MRRQVSLPEEVYDRLVAYADGRPLGVAVERLLDVAASPRREQVIAPTEAFRVEPLKPATGHSEDHEPVPNPPSVDTVTPSDRGEIGGLTSAGVLLDKSLQPACACPAAMQVKGKHLKKCPKA